jgi:curli biogenesis system outer membrane secretion channel CsgG
MPITPKKRSSIVLLALLAFAAVVAPAGADRRPTKTERSAIKRTALKACEGAGPNDCRFIGARVSTANARFAWANVVGEGYSGALLKRPTKSSRRFRVVGSQGGGIGECSYWRAHAPRRVLRDLKISGLVNATDTRICG